MPRLPGADMRAPRTLLAAVVLGAFTFAGHEVHGQAPSAKSAYEAATAAFTAKRYAEAATGFARADLLEPNAIALESALKAAVLADDPVLGMELVSRADARPVDARVEPLKKRAREAFEKRVGRIELRCGDGAACFGKVEPGGRALEPGRPIWLPVGDVVVTVSSDAARAPEPVTVSAGALVVVQALPTRTPAAPSASASPPSASASAAPTASSPAVSPSAAPPIRSSVPPSPAAPSIEPSSGLSPVWFTISAIATGGLVAGTVASGVDTLAVHDAYLAGDDSAKEPGQSAQLRTNILLGVTLAAAAATTIVAICTDWGGTATLAIGPGTARVGLRF